MGSSKDELTKIKLFPDCEEKFGFVKISVNKLELNKQINDIIKSKGLKKTKEDDFEFKLTKCCDNFVGTLQIENNKIINPDLWFCKSERLKKLDEVEIGQNINDNDGKNITIVLESPHKDEYLETKPFPALGITGCQLCLYFVNILNSYLETTSNNQILIDGVYNVILMNAIQYQCSLGVGTSKYRNIVFKELWSKKYIKKSFKDRLDKYNEKKNCVSINLCTTDLKKLIATELKEFNTLSGTHPSSWFNENNRNFKVVKGFINN